MYSGAGTLGITALLSIKGEEHEDAERSRYAAADGSENSKWASRGLGLLAVLSFWLSHTASVYATKALLARPGRTARSVVLITWCQCVTSWFLVLCLGTLGEGLNPSKSVWHPRLLAELARALPTNALLGGWNSRTLLGGGAASVGVASVLFSLAVFSDNACLGVVNASFFQVARALTLPLVTCVGSLSTGALPQRDLLLPCSLCVLGFLLGVHSQTAEAFTDGTSLGVLASLLTAAYTWLLARAEPREAWRVTYVTNRNASMLLVPVAVYVGLGDPAFLSGATFFLNDRKTILLAILAAVLPAVAGVSTLWQAQAGLGAWGQAASFVGRAACSHLLAFEVFGNSPVLVGEVGCCLVLAGLALYASRRGGAAVAQAGNVAVPAAARDHFLLDADRVAGGSDKTIAGNGAPGGAAGFGRLALIKHKNSDDYGSHRENGALLPSSSVDIESSTTGQQQQQRRPNFDHHGNQVTSRVGFGFGEGSPRHHHHHHHNFEDGTVLEFSKKGGPSTARHAVAAVPAVAAAAEESLTGNEKIYANSGGLPVLSQTTSRGPTRLKRPALATASSSMPSSTHFPDGNSFRHYFNVATGARHGEVTSPTTTVSTSSVATPMPTSRVAGMKVPNIPE